MPITREFLAVELRLMPRSVARL